MSAIFDSILTVSFDPGIYLICILTAFVCGILTALTVSRKEGGSRSMLTSLVVLPPIVTTVIMMVNGSIGTGLAVMGAFSLIRFRSAAGKAKDIVTLFLVMTAGLIAAGGYVAVAILFTLIVCAALLLMDNIRMGADGQTELSITVPESLSFAHAFDDLFERYTRSAKLIKTKTINMGSLYKLYYRVEMKKQEELQAMLDEIRCRNGNLEISAAEAVERSEEL